MQVYELGYLILPSIPEDELTNVVLKLKSAIGEAGGKELESEEPLKYDLAYTMTKTVGASRYVVNEAYIGWVKFEAEVENVEPIKTKVEKMNEVLRFLLIKAPRETTFTFAKAKAIQAEREAEERGDDEMAAPTLEEVGVPTETSGNKI